MENNNNTNVCPCCGKHCDLSAPNCERGEEYIRTGVIPERKAHGGHGDHKERCHHGGHGHGGCEKHGRHGEHKSVLDSERYGSMDTDEKLMTVIRELGHASRFQFGGKGGQNRVLHILAREGTMTQRAMTERLGIQPGSASEVIGKLERAGLVLRAESEEDRRTANISLTQAGKAQAEELSAQRQNQMHEMFAALTDEEKTSLLSGLEKLCRSWSGRAPKE